MKKIEIITRPEKLNDLKKVLTIHNSQGMTVMSVMGCGRQKGYIEELNITGDDINLLPKIMVFAVVEDSALTDIMADITSAMGTGKTGYGKVFVYDVCDALRIRTNERGDAALN